MGGVSKFRVSQEEKKTSRLCCRLRHPLLAQRGKPFSEIRTNRDKPSSSGSIPASTGEVSLIHLAIVQPALPSPQALSFGGTRRRKVFDHFHRGQHDFLKKRLQAACGILFGERSDLSGKLCQIERCVEIPLENETAEQIVADIHALREIHLLFHLTTARTPLGRREPAICQTRCPPLPHRLVAYLAFEFPPTHIADGKRKLVIALHAVYIQVFQDHQEWTQGSINERRLPQLLLDLLLFHAKRSMLR